MYYFRVTKYNPIYRDENGFYKKNEWISVGDIGQCYDGEILTAENYQNIENAYVNAILSAVYELKVKSFNNMPSKKRLQRIWICVRTAT